MNNKKEMDDILQRSSLKENPFGTPKGYFETMQQEVLEKISAMPVAPEYDDEVQEQEPATFKTYFVPAFSLAAMFGIIFGLGYGAMKLTGTGEGSGLPEQAVFSENVEEFEVPETELSEDDMMNILHISIEDLIAAQNAEFEIEVQIDDQEIEEYLIENRVPTSHLALLEQY
ncbi:MAG: hypothetical protein J6R57_04005 [Bacteroidales bacterium]|nr:hypothetical protein [Bacteroidales bacterium]